MTKQVFSNQLLHEALRTFVQDEQWTGLAVAIVKGKQILFNGVYGTLNIQSGEPLTSSTLFHQASVSKTFVATAIMQLVERSQIDLDATVKAYLPYFNLDDDRYTEITIRQLLSHISGMPDADNYGWDRPEYDEQSLERYVKSLTNLKLNSHPGERFSYSNIGYEILGDVIAKISGLSFEQYMKQSILEPLNMYSSSFLMQEVQAHIATPHVLSYFPDSGYGGYISQVFPYNRAHGPSSTLYTNAKEMGEYLIMHLNKGTARNGNILLSSHSYEEMWRIHATPRYSDIHAEMGLSWFMGQYNGSRLLSHSGWDTGFLSEIYIFPEEELAISIMTNCDYVLTERLFLPIFDLMQGSNTIQFKRSIAHSVAEIALKEGIEQAVQQFECMILLDQASYEVKEYEFIRISDLFLWSGRPEEGHTILKCAAIIFPESSTIKSKLKEY